MQIVEVTELSARCAVLTVRHREKPLRFVVFPMLHVAQPAFSREVTRRLRVLDLVVVEGVGTTTPDGCSP